MYNRDTRTYNRNTRTYNRDARTYDRDICIRGMLVSITGTSSANPSPKTRPTPRSTSSLPHLRYIRDARTYIRDACTYDSDTRTYNRNIRTY